MRDERRPWVAINGIVSIEKLWFSQDLNGILIFDIAVTVTGQMPAQHVFASAVLIPDDKHEDLLMVQKRLCDSFMEDFKIISPDDSKHVNITIFPGQTRTINVGAIDPDGNLRNYRDKGFRKVSPFVVGCVSYQDPMKRPHRTGFVYRLFAIDDIVASGVKGIDLVDSIVSGDKLKIWRDIFGDGPAD